MMPTRTNRRPNRRSGMALMLVLPAVALAAVLAYAVLANIGTQEQISANAASIAQAHTLAESGINYAMYNLEYPGYAPANFLTNGSGNVTLGPGTFSVAVAGASSPYTIVSTGTVNSPTGTTITRTISATVQTTSQAVQPQQAVGINGMVTLGANMTVTGDLRTNNMVTLNPGAAVTGDVYSTSLVQNGGTDAAYVQVPSGGDNAAPTVIKDYRTYTYAGVQYNATLLASDPAAGTTLGPTGSNPAGIYYRVSTTGMNLKGVTINGTLMVMKNGTTYGKVTVTGANTISPVSGFPGLLADTVAESGTMTVNGLTWAKTGISGNGTLTINGALLIPGAAGISSYTGALNLNYNAKNVAVPSFSTQTQTTIITVLSWSEQ